MSLVSELAYVHDKTFRTWLGGCYCQVMENSSVMAFIDGFHN
jgi:hypothetical protein